MVIQRRHAASTRARITHISPLAPYEHVDERDDERELTDAQGRPEVLGAEELGESNADGEGRQHDDHLGEHGPGL